MARKGTEEAKPRPCPACHGAGGRWEVKGGNGQTKEGRSRQVWAACKQCNGSGYK